MAVIQVVDFNGAGLMYVSAHQPTDVNTDMFSLRRLRNPPTNGELQTLNRQMLLELASKSGERFPRNGSKAVLADLVIAHWRPITQSYADEVGRRSVFQNEELDLAHQMYEDATDDETNSDTSSINPPTMFEYHGQPHRQEPLPQGWNTPRSVATTEVINSDEPEHFSSDVSDAGLSEMPSGSQDVVPVEMDKFEMDENPNIKSLHGKTFKIASKDKPTFKVFVVIPMKHTEVRFTLVVDAGVKVEDVFEMVGNKTGGTIPSGQISAYVKDVSSEVYPSEPISWFCDDGHTLLLRPRVRGGGRAVKKPFLKTKEEAVSFLKSTYAKNYQPNDEDNLPNEQLPDEIIALVAKVNTKYAEFLTIRQRCGQHFTALGLKQLSQEDLAFLEGLFKSNRAKTQGRNLTTEEKFIQATHILFEPIKMLNNCEKKLLYTKEELTTSLLKLYVDEFGNYSETSGNISLDAGAFYKLVDAEVKRRALPSIPEVNEQNVGNTCSIQ